MLVRQILQSKPSADVATIGAGASVADAARKLSELKIGALVVSEGDGVAEGILSERDIVRELGRRGPNCMGDRVSELMTSSLSTCTADQSADQVLAKMTEGRFRHLPVVEGDRMIGLISIGDVVKARLSELSMEKEALEGMIMGH